MEFLKKERALSVLPVCMIVVLPRGHELDGEGGVAGSSGRGWGVGGGGRMEDLDSVEEGGVDVAAVPRQVRRGRTVGR